MLSIFCPRFVRHVTGRKCERFGKEGLILEHEAEAVLKPSQSFEKTSPDHRITGRRRLHLVFEQQVEQDRGLVPGVRPYAEWIIKVLPCRAAFPTVPNQRPTVDHA